MAKKNLIDYIKKYHIKAVQKFNEELAAVAKETGESPVTLYEDANTSFTLCDIAISQDGQLFYTYDGQVEFEVEVRFDEETNDYYEEFGSESTWSTSSSGASACVAQSTTGLWTPRSWMPFRMEK